jgi:hypothetical protein
MKINVLYIYNDISDELDASFVRVIFEFALKMDAEFISETSG